MTDYKAESTKLKQVILDYKKLLITIKGSPDPDAIASSLAMKLLCETLGIQADLVARDVLSLTQNRAFVKVLSIPVLFQKEIKDIGSYDAYVVMDHQSVFIEGISDKLPCAAHIDHHEEVEETIQAKFKLIRHDVGSTCTIIALIWKELKELITEENFSQVATALVFGIQTDTDKYTHALKNDYVALQFLSQYSNPEIINRLNGIPLSRETSMLLNRAIENQEEYKDWLITGVGYVNETNRDSIAIIADFLLSRSDSRAVVVFAIVEKKKRGELIIDASFRSRDEDLNLNGLIKSITPAGGARTYKGAFQIDINFFSFCPERELLWTLVSITVTDILKKRRDGFYMVEMKSAFGRFKKKLNSIINKS